MLSHYPVSGSAVAESPLAVSVSQDDLVFDGYSLSNGVDRICNALDYDDQGKIDFNTFNFPRDDGGGVLTKYYRGRTIKARVTLKSDTVSEFNTLLDTFKK